MMLSKNISKRQMIIISMPSTKFAQNVTCLNTINTSLTWSTAKRLKTFASKRIRPSTTLKLRLKKCLVFPRSVNATGCSTLVTTRLSVLIAPCRLKIKMKRCVGCLCTTPLAVFCLCRRHVKMNSSILPMANNLPTSRLSPTTTLILLSSYFSSIMTPSLKLFNTLDLICLLERTILMILNLLYALLLKSIIILSVQNLHQIHLPMLLVMVMIQPLLILHLLM
mmetsp:Transcript_20725/g.30821  ORF Transcript_20725/g.30821 Transcript_20725/m.30821 type:complete len:223 (+) Transcript_20725:1635-2303(+)